MPHIPHIPDPFYVPGEINSDRQRVWGRPSTEVYNYFFAGCVAGDSTAKTSLVNTFFARFHAACVAAGIPPTFDIDSTARVVEVLKRMNFEEPQVKAQVKPKRKTKPANV